MDQDINVGPTLRRKLDFGSKEMETMETEAEVTCISEKEVVTEQHSTNFENKIPKIGMVFDSEESAYKFYNEYAKLTGFGIRKHGVHKDANDRVIDRILCCACQGFRKKDERDVGNTSHRPETRTGCRAMMKIDARHTGKYQVVEFISDHNGHELVSPNKARLLRSHRSMKNIQAALADDIDYSGIAPREGFTLMAKQAGGRENVGFIFEDYKNYLRSKRSREMKTGDTGGVLEYLQQRQLDDPNFFYAIQVDEDDLIANILWVDSQMMADYAHFGDVMSFDTTYRNNKEGRPFALFVGVNHHKQTIVFGAALLYDETIPTFMWLFDTFARAMSGKEPLTILTDQDAAMAKALAVKWPNTCHRLCIWHIYQNAAIHLSSVFASFSSFSKDFGSCVYEYDEEEEFLCAWQEMLDKYGLQTNEWLERLFKIREKWALVYGRQTFCADLMSTQRSESMNSVLKRYVSYKHNLLRFFQHFDLLVDDRREKELKADLRTSHSSPVLSFPVQILKHAANIYTHEVLELFQDELHKAYDSKAELFEEDGETYKYKVISLKNYLHNVIYILSQNKVSCSCKKYEFAGILCSHALKVLSLRNIMKIPELYIKKRWTKKAKKHVEGQVSGVSAELSVSMNEPERKKMLGVHYKELCNLNNHLMTRAVLSGETFKIAKDGLLKLIEEVDSSLENGKIVRPTAGPVPIVKKSFLTRGEEEQNVGTFCGANKNLHDSDVTVVKGWKKKETKRVTSAKRLRSGLEKSTQKKKKNQTKVSLPNTEIMPFQQEHQVNMTNSCISYPVQGSTFPQANPFQSSHVLDHRFHPSYTSTPCYSKNADQNKPSLTQLLQQQLIKSRQSEGIYLNNPILEGHGGVHNA